MSLSEGRSLPSVFSDIPSRSEVDKAQKTAGRLWGWLFVLLGILVVVLIIGGIAFGSYRQLLGDNKALRDENKGLRDDIGFYSSVTDARARVLTARRALLDTLAGRDDGGRRLTQHQIDEGWRAATKIEDNNCAGPPPAPQQLGARPTVPQERYCFHGDPNATPEANERSETWPLLQQRIDEVLGYEVTYLGRAKDHARQAQAHSAPEAPTQHCDPVTGHCS